MTAERAARHQDSAGNAFSNAALGDWVAGQGADAVVLLGAHRDSWDLGTGAIDDAAGCGIVIEAARLIGMLPKHPARTIRVCLYANEENGLAQDFLDLLMRSK